MTNAESTARYVAMHGRMGTASKRRRMPRAQPPRLIESDFAATLVGLVKEWRAALGTLPADMFAVRTDDIRQAKPQLQRARNALNSTIRRTSDVAERTAKRVSDHGREQIARQTEAALGVQIPTLDRGVPRQIQGFIHENASLIQKLGNRTLDDVEVILARAWNEGLDADEVGKLIAERFDIAERHARFIARDQVTKLYSQVTRARHQEIGVQTFRWMTQKDGNVRSAHAVKHGRIFPYEGSRAPSFMPGEETGCRCWEEPVFDEIRGMANVGSGRKRIV